jgi:hypothetical protein
MAEWGLDHVRKATGKLNVALTDSSNSFLATAKQVLRLDVDSVETRIVQGMTLLETS